MVPKWTKDLELYFKNWIIFTDKDFPAALPCHYKSNLLFR